MLVAHDVNPLLRAARHAAGDDERSTCPLDHVQPLHPERFARPNDRRSVVGIVRSIEDDDHAREPPPDDVSQSGASFLGDQRLQNPQHALDPEALGASDTRIDELLRA